jgi:poly(A) polymerase
VHGNPEIAADVEFWREAQTDPAHAAELLEAERSHEAGAEEGAPARRRRRRRRSGPRVQAAGAPE